MAEPGLGLYMKPSEFTELCIDVAEEIGYVQRERAEHPGDLAVNLAVVMQSVAAGMSEAIRRQAKK